MKILFFDLDTLRPDHLGCYGYPRNTTPNIDKIASEGVAYNQYYCSDAPCLPSRAALMTGRFGIHTGVINHGGTAADMRLDGTARVMQDLCARDNMPAVLRNYGYYTAMISSFADRHSAYWFYAGFNEMHDIGKRGMESAEDVTPTALKWIEDNKDRENWYLHINYWDAHTPYRAPLDFGNPFADEPVPAESWVTDDVLEEHKKHVGPHSASELSMFNDSVNPKVFPRMLGKITNREEWRDVMDSYDIGIRYMDGHIGQVVEAVKNANGGTLDDVAIIVTADHGENMGELGIYAEHATADESTCRIPMIVKWPGCRKNSMDDGLHYNLDLIPTLMELLGEMPPKHLNPEITGIPPAPRYDGQSFAKTLLQGEESGREYLVVSQCCHVCQRSVRFGEWFYIQTYHDGYHLNEDEMLFNIKEDPHETRNLAQEKRETCYQAVYLLNKWHTEQMKKMVSYSQVDPLWTVMAEGGPFHAKGHLTQYCERLQATGRGYAADELKKRHPGEL